MRPHRQQPTRFLHPWDSPGKNTGVGCHFLLQCMKVKSESEVAQSCPTLSKPVDCSPSGSSVHGTFQAWVPEWVAIAFSACIDDSHKKGLAYILLVAQQIKQPSCSVGETADVGSILRSGRSPGGGNGNSLQYSCLKNQSQTPWMGFPGGSDGKEFACNAGDLISISGLRRSPGEVNGNLLHYSCLENSICRGAWWTSAFRVSKNQTGLSD